MRFAFKIHTQVLPVAKDAPLVLQAVERGWEVTEEITHNTINGVATFTVMARVLAEGTRYLEYPKDLFPLKLHKD